MAGITLIVDREMDNLWSQRDGINFEVIWDVTGVKQDDKKDSGYAKIMRKGEQIGIVWDVVEIRERW